MVKRMYCYYDNDGIILSHDKPPCGTVFIEKIIGNIGIPDVRAVSLKTQEGKLLYNNLEYIPLEDKTTEYYLKEVIQ